MAALLIGGLISQTVNSQVLVLVHDSTITINQAKRQADLDTLRRHLATTIGTSYTMRKFDTTTTYADLNNFCTIIVQETSFDAITCRWMGAALRNAIKTWLQGGTPVNKRSLVIIGGDLSYNYDRSGSAGIDTSFCRGTLGFSYLADNGNLTVQNGAYQIVGLVKDSVTTSPAGGGFYPDAIRPSWVSPTPFYGHSGRGATDSLSGVIRNTANYVVISLTEDPRYFVGAGGSAGADRGFKRVLTNLLNAVTANGGCLGAPSAGPNYLHYKFENNPSAQSTPNCAVPGVGNNPATFTGVTLTSGGQFDSCLAGTGTTNIGINTGWNTNLGTSSWTISFWLSTVSTTSIGYLFGDPGANSFRSFYNGAAGTNNMIVRFSAGGGAGDLIINSVVNTPVVVTIVYDSAAGNVKGYKDGVLANTVVYTANITTGTGFKVGGYSTSAGINGKMDEFRLYRRALSAAEVAATWNVDIACQLVLGAHGNNNEIPSSYKLFQNYPNPFNPKTTIEFAIPRNGFVQIKLFDVLGREVRTLVSENYQPGYHSIQVDGSNLSSGVYFYKIVSGDFVDTKKLMLIK